MKQDEIVRSSIEGPTRGRFFPNDHRSINLDTKVEADRLAQVVRYCQMRLEDLLYKPHCYATDGFGVLSTTSELVNVFALATTGAINRQHRFTFQRLYQNLCLYYGWSSKQRGWFASVAAVHVLSRGIVPSRSFIAIQALNDVDALLQGHAQTGDSISHFGVEPTFYCSDGIFETILFGCNEGYGSWLAVDLIRKSEASQVTRAVTAIRRDDQRLAIDLKLTSSLSEHIEEMTQSRAWQGTMLGVQNFERSQPPSGTVEGEERGC